jgi:excisionase family DNA binding protein
MTTAETPLLLDLNEAAALLNVTPRWLADRVAARSVQCTRLGRRVRFSREDLDLLITQSRQPVVSAPTRRRST